MVVYPKVSIAKLIERKNRFIAHCYLSAEQKEVVVHVKNTGRCQELLYPGVTVAISYQGSATRKTAYDLIAVKKDQQWVNIDSQVPNQLAFEGIKSGKILLPGLVGDLELLKREATFGASRFDIYGETTLGEKIIVEVKGMTLENQQVGAFPDAPSVRGLKHVKHLLDLHTEGYHVYLLFIVQLENVKVATIHGAMQPELQTTIEAGQLLGLDVLAHTCLVTPDSITLEKAIPFKATQPFNNPNT